MSANGFGPWMVAGSLYAAPSTMLQTEGTHMSPHSTWTRTTNFKGTRTLSVSGTTPGASWSSLTRSRCTTGHTASKKMVKFAGDTEHHEIVKPFKGTRCTLVYYQVLRDPIRNIVLSSVFRCIPSVRSSGER